MNISSTNKIFVSLIILIGLFIFCTPASHAQRVINVNLEPTLPSFIFSRAEYPSFNLQVTSQRRITGKYFIKSKNISEKKFLTISDQKLIFEKGNKNISIRPYQNISPGIYEIFAHVVTGDYEYSSDTITYIYNADSLTFPPSPPSNLVSFWNDTFSILDSIQPSFQLIEQPDKFQDDLIVYKLNFLSFDSLNIKGWYCLPSSDKPIPAILILPSYGNTSIEIPYLLARLGFAVLSIQIHGLDVENDLYPSGDDPSAKINLDDPNKYYLRKAIAHAKRGIDFLYSQTKIDTGKIGVAGTSQGGGLALLLASLDTRVKVVAAPIPTLCCFPLGIETGCCHRVRKAVSDRLVSNGDALNTLSYFDINNHVQNIKVPVMLSVHLKDRISTPNTTFVIFNKLANSNKQMIILPKLGHNFPLSHWDIPFLFLKTVLLQ